MDNLLVRQRYELYAPSYAAARCYPANTIAPEGVPRSHFLRTQQAVIDRLAADGLI